MDKGLFRRIETFINTFPYSGIGDTMIIWLEFVDLSEREEPEAYLTDVTLEEWEIQDIVDRMNVPRKSLLERAEYVMDKLERMGIAKYVPNIPDWKPKTYRIYI